jgi:hypothetical protein
MDDYGKGTPKKILPGTGLFYLANLLEKAAVEELWSMLKSSSIQALLRHK